MPNNKSTKPVQTKSAKPVKAEVVAPKARHSSQSDAAVARVPGVMSDVEIGHVAGDVWGILVRDGSLTVSAIKKAVPAPADLVLAAIGWLAREDKLEFSAQGRSVRV